jgi:hypothetical protein
MSYFLSYFEVKNKKSENYKGFSEVGNFSIPAEIDGGNISVIYQGKIYKATILTDLSRQCSNDLFSDVGSLERTMLLSFILERLKNDCVTLCLVLFMEPEEIIQVIKSYSVFGDDLISFFHCRPEVGCCTEIVRFV